MTKIETLSMYLNKMSTLLEEAYKDGVCFAFESSMEHDAEVRAGETVIIWSDDKDFDVCVEELPTKEGA